MERFYQFLENNISERKRTRWLTAFGTGFLLTQALILTTAVSISHTVSYVNLNNDGRTVLISAEEQQQFSKHYQENLEEGWCLYGSVNATHIVIEDVVHSNTTEKTRNRIKFTCIPETIHQIRNGEPIRFIGDVHSHPESQESELSRIDAFSWGLSSALVQVRGIYTEEEGLRLYTVQSLSSPLMKQVDDQP